MLEKGDRPYWGMFAAQGSPIVWRTNGLQWTEPRGALRKGIVNINVMGKRPTVLEKEVVPIPWSVTLATDGPRDLGPESLRIAPKDCWGSNNTGCYFEIVKSLRNSNITHNVICTSPHFRAGNGDSLLWISAEGKQDAYVAYSRSTGSGGRSSSVEVLWSLGAKEKEAICAPFEMP